MTRSLTFTATANKPQLSMHPLHTHLWCSASRVKIGSIIRIYCPQYCQSNLTQITSFSAEIVRLQLICCLIPIWCTMIRWNQFKNTSCNAQRYHKKDKKLAIAVDSWNLMRLSLTSWSTKSLSKSFASAKHAKSNSIGSLIQCSKSIVQTMRTHRSLRRILKVTSIKRYSRLPRCLLSTTFWSNKCRVFRSRLKRMW